MKALEKRVDKATKRVQAQLDQLSRQPFACEADAQQAVAQFEKTLKQHLLMQIEIVEKPHYDTAGRPAKTATPTAIHYHVQATLVLNSEAVERQQRRAGRFILATNVLNSPTDETEAIEPNEIRLIADDILRLGILILLSKT